MKGEEHGAVEYRTETFNTGESNLWGSDLEAETWKICRLLIRKHGISRCCSRRFSLSSAPPSFYPRSFHQAWHITVIKKKSQQPTTHLIPLGRWKGGKNFLFFPSRFCCWSNIWNDIRQINRKNFFIHIWEPHKNMRPKGSQAIEAYMLSWAKEWDRGLGLQRQGQ